LTHFLEVSLVTNQEHLIVVVELWVEHRESNANFLPLVLELHEFLRAGLHLLSSLAEIEVLTLGIMS
jgi:hypothetical protein